MKPRLLIVLAIAAACPGCVYTSYEQHGVKMTRISFLLNSNVGRVDLAKGTLSGYESDSSQVVSAAVEAAVRGAVKP